MAASGQQLFNAGKGWGTVSRSRDLQLRIKQLREIRNIINAMKNMAFTEIHRLEQFMDKQNLAVRNIEAVAGDFFSFYPYPETLNDYQLHVCLLIGAERGFCGDFNRLLQEQIKPEDYGHIIAVGHKLHILMDQGIIPATRIDGPSTAEEVPAVLNRLIEAINLLQKKYRSFALTVFHHDYENRGINKSQLFPPFKQSVSGETTFSLPPVINLDPQVFFAELIDHYLFAVLHQMFYSSLMVENYRRLQHLEGAVQHLDEHTELLKHKSNIFRQEEITEEIEVILLTSESLR